MQLITWVLLGALAANGLLVGATLDQSIKQLPARHRIGVVAFSKYSQAADLWHGKLWYPAIGIGAPLLTLIACGLALSGPNRSVAAVPLWLSIGLSLAHSVTTGRAAPINFSQRRAGADATRLTAIFDRFERWQTVRAILQVLTLLAVYWAAVAEMSAA